MIEKYMKLNHKKKIIVQMPNASNIQHAPTETSKNVGLRLGKVLISPSSIREDAKQKPIRKKDTI